MREGQLFMTGTVGALLLAGLVALIGLDLAHRASAPRADAPVPVSAPVADRTVGPVCCPKAQPDGPRPIPAPVPPLLVLGEVPLELQALDRGLTIQLTPEQAGRLRTALATAVPADVPSPSIMIRRYPHLQIVAQGPSGPVRLVLNNRQRLSDPEQPTFGWSVPSGLWDEVASWLPPETSQPGQLSYFLRAEKLFEPNPNGTVIDYGAERAALIARILQAGRLIDLPNDAPTEEPLFTLTFLVEGNEYPVHLRANSFTIGRRTYELQEAALYVGANLHAN